jgi:hypothetical protein
MQVVSLFRTNMIVVARASETFGPRHLAPTNSVCCCSVSRPRRRDGRADIAAAVLPQPRAAPVALYLPVCGARAPTRVEDARCRRCRRLREFRLNDPSDSAPCPRSRSRQGQRRADRTIRMSAPSHERSAINHPLYHQRLKQQANHGSTAAEWGLDQDDLRHERYHRKPHRPDLGCEANR